MMYGVSEIRSEFLEFFKELGHEIVSSYPLVPHNDPTLLFTNSGMVQFKDVFTGQQSRAIKRATSSQKCLRAGGKHNDLDQVGYTARHHTFFEMLGNFSFGDYFKEEAIAWAFELVTKRFCLPKSRLCVTVYSEDDEAFALWKKIAGFSDDKIIRIPTSDNFWSMGDTGPCGPCSEIFFDHGEDVFGGPPGSLDQDGDRFVEIWNLVFMQFEQRSKDERLLLPSPSIDTGMGLERMATVLEGVRSNYETSLFRALIQDIEHKVNVQATGKQIPSFRVIADHLRASAFLIADGILPSAEGRGYVLRRIMRRAMRHAHLLGAKDPLLYQLVPHLVSLMGQAYPELTQAQALIEETLSLEEQRFRVTLEKGLRLLEEEVTNLAAGASFSGEVAFTLYDTYGFPLDLTQDVLRSKQVPLDLSGFEQAMAGQKKLARQSWAGSGEEAEKQVWRTLHEEIGATEFLGYETLEAQGSLLAVYAAEDHTAKTSLVAGEKAVLFFNQTPFYGESGGQVGDCGTITTPFGARFAVFKTQKKAGGLFAHFGVLEAGTLSLNEACLLSVSQESRQKTAVHHSATHLLHAALRQVLGPHVTQKGSLVDPSRLRFDFSHHKALSSEELSAVVASVVRVIQQNTLVFTHVLSLDDAKKLGAMALFGEKYGEEVRVVAMGGAPETLEQAYSLELCGGTHVKKTGEIGVFKILSESASSSGVRRIEALAGGALFEHLLHQSEAIERVSHLLQTPVDDMFEKVQGLIQERRKLERELGEMRRVMASGQESSFLNPTAMIEDCALLLHTVDHTDNKILKGMVDEAKKKFPKGIFVFIGKDEAKACVVTGVTSPLLHVVDAVVLARKAGEMLGGRGGGGRPDLAQAGGDQLEKIPEVLEHLRAYVTPLLCERLK